MEKAKRYILELGRQHKGRWIGYDNKNIIVKIIMIQLKRQGKIILMSNGQFKVSL